MNQPFQSPPQKPPGKSWPVILVKYFFLRTFLPLCLVIGLGFLSDYFDVDHNFSPGAKKAMAAGMVVLILAVVINFIIFIGKAIGKVFGN